MHCLNENFNWRLMFLFKQQHVLVHTKYIRLNEFTISISVWNWCFCGRFEENTISKVSRLIHLIEVNGDYFEWRALESRLFDSFENKTHLTQMQSATNEWHQFTVWFCQTNNICGGRSQIHFQTIILIVW